MNYELPIRGKRRRAALDVHNIKQHFQNQLIARFDLESIGFFSIPNCLCIRRTDDVLFARASDYASKDGPQAFNRYAYFEPPFDSQLAIYVAQQVLAEVEESESESTWTQWLSNEREYGQLSTMPNLDRLGLPEERLLAISVWEVFPTPKEQAVALVNVRICEMISLNGCHVRKVGKDFRVDPPRHHGALVRSAHFEELFSESLSAAFRSQLASLDVVPFYLREARDRAREEFGFN